MESKTAVEPLLEQIVARIVEQAQPEKVILFGSRARGDARSSSDFDILVIKESDEPRSRRDVPLYRALAGLWADVDIIVYTPEEVWEWSAVPQAFVTTAVREGKVLYEGKPCAKAKAGSSMKEKADLVRGWLRRARSDLVAMEVLLNAGAFDAACFHAQQAAEKYLKAFLIHHDTQFPFTHELDKLIKLCAGIDPSFQSLATTADSLTPYAMKLRYDETFWPALEEAQAARASALAGKEFVHGRLPKEIVEKMR